MYAFAGLVSDIPVPPRWLLRDITSGFIIHLFIPASLLIIEKVPRVVLGAGTQQGIKTETLFSGLVK